MQSLQNGTQPGVQGEPSSLYALVIYLPEPLCGFLDDLRVEMVPDYKPHAHVSVLPPRPLPVAPEAAIEEARAIVAAFPPFEIELGGIDRFKQTDVIYITVQRGGEELRKLHARLNESALAYVEPYDYHPHVTLAQEIHPERVAPLQEMAAHRWRDFKGPRAFRVNHTVFVRNADGNRWVDLAEGPLLGAPVS